MQFTLFSIVFYVVGIIVCGLIFPPKFFENLPYYLSDTTLRLNDIPKKRSVKLLFIGSSHAYRGFDPRIFENEGYTCFNLGTSSQTPIQTNYLLKKYLDKLNPQTVIYEVNPEILASDGLESTLDIIANDHLNLESVELALDTKNIKSYNTFIYSYFRQVIGIKNQTPDISHKGDNYIENSGYVEKIYFFDTTNVIKEKIDYQIRASQLLAFKSIIEQLKSFSCTIILIQAPVSRREYNQYTTTQKADSIFNSYGTYYNFNTNRKYLSDSLHFYDSHHLNQKGVIIFNKKVLELL